MITELDHLYKIDNIWAGTERRGPYAVRVPIVRKNRVTVTLADGSRPSRDDFRPRVWREGGYGHLYYEDVPADYAESERIDWADFVALRDRLAAEARDAYRNTPLLTWWVRNGSRRGDDPSWQELGDRLQRATPEEVAEVWPQALQLISRWFDDSRAFESLRGQLASLSARWPVDRR